MWLPSVLVEVLIKESGFNILGTWFAGVVLVIAGNLEYVIVIYWSFSYGLFTTNCNDKRWRLNRNLEWRH